MPSVSGSKLSCASLEGEVTGGCTMVTEEGEIGRIRLSMAACHCACVVPSVSEAVCLCTPVAGEHKRGEGCFDHALLSGFPEVHLAVHYENRMLDLM